MLITGTILAPVLCPYDPYEQDLSNVLAKPSPAHLFGTDRYGRDMLSRVIIGSRNTIFSTLLLAAITTVTGTLIGLLGGWYGGIPDAALMRIADIFLAFPGMVFAIAAAGVLGGGIRVAVIALACISWPKFARLARSQTNTLKKEPFIAAARMSGCTTRQILWKHILPNMAGIILVNAVLNIGTMLMELAGLSFLGLGAVPPAAEWGSMMSNGRSMLQTCPWIVIAPGTAIFVSVMLFNLLGDALRDMLDPKMTHGHGFFRVRIRNKGLSGVSSQ